MLGHQELEQEIEIEIIEKEDSIGLERDEMFAVRLYDPEGGAKISKKDICFISIVGDNEIKDKI